MTRLVASVAVALVFAVPILGVAADAAQGRSADPEQRDAVRRAPVDGPDIPRGDDDDDDDFAPAVRAGVADVEASPPLLLLSGARFCDSPRVYSGTRDGALEELVVFNAAENFVQAGLVRTDPGTYRIVLSCPEGSGAIDLTLGAVGPQGPRGEDGILAGQSCPEGTVAIGFDLGGVLQCTARPPSAGACPCFSEETIADLEALIETTTETDPDVSALSCIVYDDFIAVDFGHYPASGDPETETHLFGRDDTCGIRTQIPGEGVVEQRLTPIAPDEAARCNAMMFESGQRLGCFE